MKSRNAWRKYIQNWIEEGTRENGPEAGTVPAPGTPPGGFELQYRYVEEDAPVSVLAEQFLHVLNSFDNRQFEGRDWAVEIAVPDRDAVLYVASESNVLTMSVHSDLASGRGSGIPERLDARLSIPFEDFRRLANFEIDFVWVMIRNKRVDDPDKPLIRPFADLLFGAYNLYHLKPALRATAIGSVYGAGKVVSTVGTERFLYPWGISADIGNVLYDLILTNDLDKSLEIGLAYGLSALFMCQAHRDKGRGAHTAVDPCQSVEFESIGVDQLRHAGLSDYFRLLEERDYEALPKLVEENEKFELIFIDGLHMHDYVVLDFFYSDLLLAVNGFVVFDDCHTPGVSSAVAYFHENRNYECLERYSDHRMRVYRKQSDDRRSIADSNHHIEYFSRYYQLSRLEPGPEVDPDPTPAGTAGAAVAITGVDGLFPTGKTVRQFWESVRDEEILYDTCDGGYLYGRQHKRGGGRPVVSGTIPSAFEFDPQFFEISRKEAELMDPQLRHLLMSVHRAIEDAGYTRERMSHGRVGVFIGSEGSDYNELHRARALEDGYFLNHSGSCIANRISYYFDLHGPCESINSMCSSGAYCLYRAVELLRRGEIDLAIVGAVKMNFSEAIFHALNGLNITSNTDSCRSFHRKSSGYVRSEGVITMILTPADEAQAQNDHIHANIREVAVNYNGRDGDSMFSPSKSGQKEVIKRCYRKARVPMSELAFVEAQGMGNEISDFVEFNAVNEAFEELSKEGAGIDERAAGPVISSVKPILGHMECASALGALLKIILSFRTGTIYPVPLLDEEDVNPKLEATGKRCRLLTETMSARRPILAGLNSFGASGTNVHILLEENAVGEAAAAEEERENVLVVSAKTEASLDRYVEELGRYLSGPVRETSLSCLCYTFQARREAYRHRAMFYLPKDSEENQVERLRTMLAQYLEKADRSDLIRDNRIGSIHHYESGPEDGTECDWEERALFRDAVSWVSGRVVEWNRHYQAIPPENAGGLPTYPFDLRAYRLEPAEEASVPCMENAMAGNVHPLLRKGSVSEPDGQSDGAVFGGEEFFLTDHRVDGQRVFPAVAYLEMARAAASRLAPGSMAAAGCLELRDVVWVQPLVVATETEVRIVFETHPKRLSEGAIDYEIYSRREAEDRARPEALHCQGQAALGRDDRVSPLDLEALQKRMQRGCIDPDALYDAFDDLGIAYGRSYRGVKAIYRGDHELLAEVDLPDAACDTQRQFVLHPGLLDSALQAGSRLIAELHPDSRHPALPFALEALQILAPCTTRMFAWVRRSRGSGDHDGVVKLDVDLCDPSGDVCVLMKGFSARIFSGQVDASNMQAPMTSREGRRQVEVEPPTPPSHPVTSNAMDAEPRLRERCTAWLRTLVAGALKAAPDDIRPNEPFSTYGLDSLMVVQLTNRLRKSFAGVTSTLFFEVQSVSGLAEHLLENNRAELMRVVGGDTAEPAAGRAPSSAAVGAAGAGASVPFAADEPPPRVEAAAVRSSSQEVAVVGLSGRYPQAANMTEFWRNLSEGVNCISEIPKSRWNWEEFYDPDGAPGTSYTRWGGFIRDFDRFDPLFFRISPLEAEGMDPQERIFLETCYHAIEDAGYTPANLADNRKVGLFIGVTNSMYTRAPDHFSLANRASYLFDFQGPSMAVDTACSSSLTAIHLALESIRNGSCECAIAGGVNLLIDPVHYVRLSEMAALSGGRECRPFGEGADGFIDAEGVGAVVLKPLEQAERDRDQVYGIIKASAVNAGGKTNGYTVPNPKAQFSLISDALKRANLEGEDVTYVEAHGTGTPLGDPIEISGLSRAFGETTARKQFCSIGSLKSNIGHCEAAAGIAGFTKVLLQLKHRQLFPSLHSDAANPEIRFGETPFCVQTRLEKWERPVRKVNGVEREMPRIAGVSSFGIGGANAHLIVQEHAEPECSSARDAVSEVSEVAVPLSARTADQLKRKAADLLEFIQAPQGRSRAAEDPATGAVDLAALAYTLQVGREPMEERLGLAVGSVEELAQKLEACIRGDSPEGVHTGRLSGGSDILTLFNSDANLQKAVDDWLACRRISRLLDLWVQGLELDWRKLYGERTPKRISLPTYPFARERYWKDPASARTGSSAATPYLHPLLHCNRSDLGVQRYTTKLSGAEFFLSDHQIGGRKVLPAAACLEMARAAVVQAVPASDAAATELRNIAWGRPFIAEGSNEIGITLLANEHDELEFQIYSEAEGNDVVHCSGHAVLSEKVPAAKLDLEQLGHQMRQATLDATDIYAAFERAGVHLGPAHRAVTAVHRGEQQLLARLCLPGILEEGREDYRLHPSLMDGALHACIGLVPDLAGLGDRPLLPFALESMLVLSGCPDEMIAWIRYARNAPPRPDLIELDVDLCDRGGTVCVQLRGLSSRLVDSDTIGARRQAAAGDRLLMTPVWRPGAPAVSRLAGDADGHCARRHVVLCGMSQVDAKELEDLSPRTQCLVLPPTEEHIATRYSRDASAVFTLVRDILKRKPNGQELVQVVIADRAEQALLAGLSGLLETAHLENPSLAGQVILAYPEIGTADLARELEENAAAPRDAIVRYEHGARQLLTWEPVEDTDDAPLIPFKDQGVYLVTGGLGGPGVPVAREILAQAVNARVVLTGRSELTAEKRTTLDELSARDGRVEYRQADLSDQQQVERLVAAVLSGYRQLNGIIHGAAGTASDGYMVQKTPEEFSRVLSPEVTGTFNLDEASRSIELDFVVVLSAFAGAAGNPGQSDYATAKSFNDHFAVYRNRLVRRGRRFGHTLSMNWPFRQDARARMDEASRDSLRHATGAQPVATEACMDALYRSLVLGCAQAAIAEGGQQQSRRTTLARETARAAPAETLQAADGTGSDAAAASASGTGRDGSGDAAERCEAHLIRILCEVLKLPPQAIDPQAPFENYGMDSILAMKLTSRLERTFGSLSKTLFFEYRNVRALAAYFAKAHPQIVHEAPGTSGNAAATGDAQAVRTGRVPMPVAGRKGRFVAPVPAVHDDIAIVGIAGRYPLADDLDEFWSNLKSGRDCITEIPTDRWDHDRYFAPDRKQAGKSYTKWGGFIRDVDKFDPLFFNISPREAELIDPQERLFLETVWHTIEDAGYSKEAIARKRAGVYVGVMWGQYELFGADSGANTDAMVPGSSYASIANRVSWFFDFRGPSMAIDTMCSSSLTAMHLACEEIRKGEVDVAVAGGVNVSIHPNKYLNLSQGSFASSDGKCRSFGEGGDGYVPGEGVGAVLLKPLRQALEDGDQVHAVIKSSTVNHGGKTHGYTVPNPNAQAELIADALRRAGIDPSTLSYVECHGTGTSLGDPIEITGLTNAFEELSREEPSRKQLCPIGSVKSNIGHLESAAGIAGVTKALLQLKHEQLVPSLHANRLNSHIRFEESPFYVQTELKDWRRRSDHPRRIGVSSFGAGGANAHLILEEHVGSREIDSGVAAGGSQAFVLSARDKAALVRYTERIVEFLQRNPAVSLADVAYTSQVARTPMNERLAVVAGSLQDLEEKLRRWLAGQEVDDRQFRELNADDLNGIYSGSVRTGRLAAESLIEGAAGNAFLNVIMEGRDLAKIAKLWASGVEIEWSHLYRDRRPERVTLPTYPFARQRYWVDTPRPLPPAAGAAEPRSGHGEDRSGEEKRRLHYTPRWRPSAITGSGRERGPTLILGMPGGSISSLTQRLGDLPSDGPIIHVYPGDAYQETRPYRFTIDTRREEHFNQLVGELKNRGHFPRQVLHDCGELHSPPVLQRPARTLHADFYALFCLCRALMKENPNRSPVRILSAFESSVAASAPQNAAIGGFLRTMTLENPDYLGKVVEFQGGPNAEISASDKASMLVDELTESDWNATEVRYQYPAEGEEKQLCRYLRELKPFTPSEGDVVEVPLKQGAVYVIAGGLGGLGFIIGDYLAKKCQARLVLLGRSPLTTDREGRLRELERHATDVLYVQTDVSNLEETERGVARAKARFSEIDGVIHCAGVNRDSFILHKSREEIESVLRPKVYGAVNLDHATRREDLDIFVLFSSVTGAMGNVGQSDYAYANHFLDSFAAARESLRVRQERSGRTWSINWPFWEEGGMSVSREHIALAEAETGLCAMPTDQGVRYWEEFLHSDVSQGIALYGYPSKIESWLRRQPGGEVAGPESAAGASLPGDLIEDVEDYLKELVGQVVKLAPEQIDAQERFESFGIDSVMAGQINARLQQDLGALPKTLLYEYETVEQLAAYLVRKVRRPILRLFRTSAADAADPDEAPAAGETEPPLEHEPLPALHRAATPEPVAIIGVHGHYPGSGNLEEYWEHLSQGRDLLELVPASRWNYEEFYDPDPDRSGDGKIYCKWGGFLDDVAGFDAPFFKITPQEARLIDPQERLFLESVWAAIEDAGYTRDSLKKTCPKAKSADVGVFVGVTTSSYDQVACEEWSRGNAAPAASLPWSIANRVSYFFDFQGPSLPVDTACSSSLVALHLACESLRKRECRVAVAGGVNLYLHPSKYSALCQRRMVSTDGKCRSFGAGDGGFVPGEGVGAVLLKPLSMAIEDHDHIHAVVAASAFDHSGRSNGYSAPNPNSQASLIARTLESGRIHPESIGYVEGHGTATQLGDSLEIAALTKVFQRQTGKKRFCPVGCVKANIGHGESAAGIASVAKVLLQMEHEQLAPTIHAEDVNPDIDFRNSPFYLQHALEAWTPHPEYPRRALVNSFGAGGVNACVVLEQYRSEEPITARPRDERFLFVLSARTEGGLRRYADRLLTHLRKQEKLDLASLTLTLQLGREAMAKRLAIVIADVEELIEYLSAWIQGQPCSRARRGNVDPGCSSGRQASKAAVPTAQDGTASFPDLDGLAEAWCAGRPVDWEALYPEEKPPRIPLPTYPFSRQHYWVSDSSTSGKSISEEVGNHGLHPLISYNSSTLASVSLTSLLSDGAYYARDHKVNDEAIFPGAGFLEIACIAGSMAAERKVCGIRDVIWAHPLSFKEGTQRLRTFFKAVAEDTEYEIVSIDEHDQRIVHSEGKLCFQSASGGAPRSGSAVSIPDLKSGYSSQQKVQDHYAVFRRFGLDYGPAFQAIRESHSNGSSALSRLELPGHLRDDYDQYILHPSMIDAAFQTVASLIESLEPGVPYLPFALDRVEIIRPIPCVCYAYVESVAAADRQKAGLRKFDIELLSMRGNLLVTLKGLYVRARTTALKHRDEDERSRQLSGV